MAQGYERRQETQPLARAQIRPARVSGPGVGMPGGAAPQVDTSVALAIGELARFGSSAMGDLIERKRKENYLEGQAMYAQGQSLVELEDSGANYFHKQGWQTMDAQNAGALWAVAQEQKIDEADFETDPEEYRKNMAKATVELTKGRDPASSAMVMEIANKYIPGLAAKQFQKNAAYRKTRTMTAASDSVATLSAADIDRADWESTLSREEGSTLSKLSDEDYNSVMVNGILKAYENDNPNAHKWAEESGKLNGMDAASLGALRNAQSTWQTRQEQKYNENYTMQIADLQSQVSAGKLPIPDALAAAQKIELEAGHRFDQADASRIVSAVLSEQERRQRGAEAEAKADARAAELEAKNQQYALAFQDYALKAFPLKEKLANKLITPQEFIDQNTDLIKSFGLPFTQGFAADAAGTVAQAHAQWLEQDAKNLALSQANATGDYTGLSSGQVQDAIDLKRVEIFQGAQDAIAEGRGGADAEQRIKADANAKWTNFLEQSGNVDAKTQAVFNTFLKGSLIDSKGEVPVNVEQSFAQFMDMYESNPQLAMRHITGADAQARMKMMIAHYQEPGNFGGALQSVALAEANARATGMDFTKSMQDPVMQSTIRENVAGLIQERGVDWKDVVFGNTTVSQYMRTNDESLERAAAGATPVLQEAITNEAIRLKSRNPALDDQSAIEAARETVQSQTTYIGGSFIRMPGVSLYDRIFGKGGAVKYGNNASIPNEAVYNYLRVHGQDLYGENLFSDTKGDPELSITLSPTGNGFSVAVRRQQSPLDKLVGRRHEWTTARPIIFRDIGMAWEKEYKNKLQEPQRVRESLPPQGLTPELMKQLNQ